MKDQPGLLSVVLLGRHEHRLVATQLTALAHECEQTPGRAEPPASVSVECLPQLAMDGVGLRGRSFPGGAGRSGEITEKARTPLRVEAARLSTQADPWSERGSASLAISPL
jgi:hypothetical protein